MRGVVDEHDTPKSQQVEQRSAINLALAFLIVVAIVFSVDMKGDLQRKYQSDSLRHFQLNHELVWSPEIKNSIVICENSKCKTQNRTHPTSVNHELVWSPEIKNSIVICENSKCKTQNRTHPTSVFQKVNRVLFAGDSTMKRLFNHKMVPECSHSWVISTDRCNFLERIQFQRARNWTKPNFSEGPTGFGLQHPFCTDCDGCNGYIAMNATSNSDCVVYNYIPLEFARDVEMQSIYASTTQENVALFLRTNPLVGKNDVCIMNAGLHDMSTNVSDARYVENVRQYINLFLPLCNQGIIWIETTTTATDNFVQKKGRISLWNKLIADLILQGNAAEFNDLVFLLQVEKVSKLVKFDRTSNVHMHDSFYKFLHVFIMRTLLFF